MRLSSTTSGVFIREHEQFSRHPASRLLHHFPTSATQLEPGAVSAPSGSRTQSPGHLVRHQISGKLNGVIP